MKTIGIIGGLGPQATLDILDRMHKAYNRGFVAQAAVAYLRTHHVDGIILGCTELPLLLGKKSEQPDIINPSQLLAEAAVRYAIGK